MMNPKLQAVLDMFEHFGPDLTCATSEWSDLTCHEQMIVESQIFQG